MEKRLLKVREVAVYLGIRPATVYAWARAQKLPSLKIGGRLLFDRRDLDRLIEKSKRPSVSEAVGSTN